MLSGTIPDMEFSIIFWNVWLDTQKNGMDHARHLLEELGQLIERHDPDCFGLNEILGDEHAEAFVLSHLAGRGYAHVHHLPNSPWNDEWRIGSAIASKYTITAVKDLVIGQDVYAHRRGYGGHTAKTIMADIQFGNDVQQRVMITHLPHLRSYTMAEHYRQSEKLYEYIQKYGADTPLILGGDFNEPRLMPNSFRARSKELLNVRTGGVVKPTWQHNGYMYTPVRANLDKVFWTKHEALHLEHFEVLTTNVSDHKPLHVVFRISD